MFRPELDSYLRFFSTCKVKATMIMNNVPNSTPSTITKTNAVELVDAVKMLAALCCRISVAVGDMPDGDVRMSPSAKLLSLSSKNNFKPELSNVRPVNDLSS